jgi:hypothetical protein
MRWCFELVCTGAGQNAAAEARSWLDQAAPVLSRLPDLSALDGYVPAAGDAHDPFNRDGQGPSLLAMLAFPSREALTAALATLDLARAIAGIPGSFTATGTALERRFYPVRGETRPAPLAAAFSYVVRYHRPADDEKAFVESYVGTHARTLGELPGIRSVMCYFPLRGVAAAGVDPVEYIIGNEVAFDSIGDFNIAMQSPVRQELRRHFHELPRFTGPSTHFPMQRRRLAG